MADPATLDISQPLAAIVPIVKDVLGVTATWAIAIIAHRLAALLRLKRDDVIRGYLTDGWTRAFAYAQAEVTRLIAEHHTVTLPDRMNLIERSMAAYMSRHFADGLAHFGATPEHVADAARAWLNHLMPAPDAAVTVVTPTPSPTDATKPAWGTAAGYAGP